MIDPPAVIEGRHDATCHHIVAEGIDFSIVGRYPNAPQQTFHTSDTDVECGWRGKLEVVFGGGVDDPAEGDCPRCGQMIQLWWFEDGWESTEDYDD